MNFWLRSICCLIALLIAGKEVIALGHASVLSSELSMSDSDGASPVDWVIECEEAPEGESESETTNVVYDETHDCHLTNVNLIRRARNTRLFLHHFYKFTVTEFYIYVLNLRL